MDYTAPPHYSRYLNAVNVDLFKYFLKEDYEFELSWGNHGSVYIRHNVINISIPKEAATCDSFTDLLIDAYKEVQVIKDRPKPKPMIEVDKDHPDYFDFYKFLMEVDEYKKIPRNLEPGV